MRTSSALYAPSVILDFVLHGSERGKCRREEPVKAHVPSTFGAHTSSRKRSERRRRDFCMCRIDDHLATLDSVTFVTFVFVSGQRALLAGLLHLPD